MTPEQQDLLKAFELGLNVGTWTTVPIAIMLWEAFFRPAVRWLFSRLDVMTRRFKVRRDFKAWVLRQVRRERDKRRARA